MKWFWTWSGRCFGYQNGDNIWTHNGKHIGRVIDNEIYSCTGQYLGEIRNTNFLITNTNKKHRRVGLCANLVNQVPRVKQVDRVGQVMIVSHEDFPHPDSF